MKDSWTKPRGIGSRVGGGDGWGGGWWGGEWGQLCLSNNKIIKKKEMQKKNNAPLDLK